MSYLHNDPAEFADDLIAGFLAANPTLARRVPGGVARRSTTKPGRVALVIGGGSGHYPAFAGLIGRGLADGAALGNVFASPSTQQIHGVATAVAADAGVLLSYGNYAGDVLNFDQAETRLIADGIPTRTVVVTDDVSSAGKDEIHKRRGIAGDLPVFRAAAWAAAQGRDLDGVADLADRANDRTRSIGVAFTGCTLPGADEPLFTVPEGRMAVGMGIHGEPGIDEQDMPSAAELAQLLVEKLFDELPEGIDAVDGQRVAVILNGLGRVKYEELFVVYGRVAALLDEAGVTVVQPDVGELVTSFDMAGVSLTFTWLDDELEQAWTSPAETPAYRKGDPAGLEDEGEPADDVDVTDAPQNVPDADDDSRAVAHAVVAAIDAMKSTIDEHADELGRLDAVAGDGDHGIGMQRGVTAAAKAANAADEAGAGAGTVLARAGDAWADKAGGTSGALWGLALRAVGETVGDTGRPSASSLGEALTAARDALVEFGKAELGDKTMLDAVIPFVDEFIAHDGDGVTAAWTAATATAKEAADATADLTPRIGRARPHAEKSVGTPDPGAVSFALAAEAVASTLSGPPAD